DAEGMKRGAGRFVACVGSGRRRWGRTRYGDTGCPAITVWVVVQRRVARLTVRINVGWRGCATTATGPHAFLVNAVRRVKVKPLTAGAFDDCANKVLRRRGVLGVVAAHAVV